MTQVWAHRGACESAPENTLPAFELALESGVDGVEFDVQMTSDGHAVVFHDETLTRVAGVTGWLRETTLAQLQRLDASMGRDGFAGTRIPTLNEVLSLLGPAGVWVNIELKNAKVDYPGLEDEVVQLVEQHRLRERVSVSSFNHYSLRRLGKLEPGLRLGALYSDPLYRPWRYAAKLGSAALHPPLYATTRKLINKCHEHGLQAVVWTVNDEPDLKRMGKYLADAVITNHPQRAISLLR